MCTQYMWYSQTEMRLLPRLVSTTRTGSRLTSASLSNNSHRLQLPRPAPFYNSRCSISYSRTDPRSYSRTMSTASSSIPDTIAFSSNTDADEATPRLRALVNNDSNGWSLTDDKRGLKREIRFKTFKTTWDFMNVVAEKCKEEKHHPEWTNVYNKVIITWTTHRPQGLSHRDLTMAEFCDEQARERGEIVPE